MLATKRYDYVPFDSIQVHPSIANHRAVNPEKVRHYKDDILKNGLLEPLVVWERNHGEFFLVGGFHRRGAIHLIRQEKPGYYDRVDVRVVAGDLEEMRALNLKLNADRLDAKITEYFDTDHFPQQRQLGQAAHRRLPGQERELAGGNPALRAVHGPAGPAVAARGENFLGQGQAHLQARAGSRSRPGKGRGRRRPEGTGSSDRASPRCGRVISAKIAHKRLQRHIKQNPSTTFTVSAHDLFALLSLLAGQSNGDTEVHLEQVRSKFPGLVD
jgi:ParB family chromosome partitioning protein